MSLLRRDPLANPEELIPRVYAYAAYRLGAGHDAEDVTSEVFERALRYRKSYDRSKGEPVAWLLGIAQRCISAALSARAERPLEILEAADGRSMEEESIRRLTLAAAVARLGDRDQELIALRFGADLTAAQIAQVLGAETNTIEVAMHRALRRLRTLLEVDEGDATQGSHATAV
jgi:RNA polymerase sigma factor (sigma-70 family)